MNLYKIEGELKFTDNHYVNFTALAVDKEFTDDEIRYGIDYVKGKVVLDKARMNADQKAAAQAALDEYNGPILERIREFESKAVRPTRAIMRAIQEGGKPDDADIKKLIEVDDQIKKERELIKK
jgi:hypothetical protein